MKERGLEREGADRERGAPTTAVTTVRPEGDRLSAETENKKQTSYMKERGVEKYAKGEVGRAGEEQKRVRARKRKERERGRGKSESEEEERERARKRRERERGKRERGKGKDGRKDGTKDVVTVRQCWLSNRCHCQCLAILTAHDQIFSYYGDK